MAISPPSDLVLDVVRAADPNAVQEAQARLKAQKAAFAATSLADAGKGFGSAMNAMSALDTTATAAGLGNPQASKNLAEMPVEYRKFEASVLSTFVNALLPDDQEQVYGKGSAGEFWKSMMAEKIADEIAKKGGVGIAEQMYSQALNRAEQAKANASTDETDRSRAVSMIMDFERQVLGVGSEKEAI